jgi:hypothetical protein
MDSGLARYARDPEGRHVTPPSDNNSRPPSAMQRITRHRQCGSQQFDRSCGVGGFRDLKAPDRAT